MAFIAAASIIGLGTLASGGLGFAGAQSQASAAKEAGNAIADATKYASFLQQANLSQVQQLLSPFIQLGTGAGASLAFSTVSPDEMMRQRSIQRNQLEAAIPRLLTDADIPVFSGKDASERRATYAYSVGAQNRGEIADAQKRLEAFDKETELLKDQIANPPKMEASPLYQFQEELGTRNLNRELAARGLYNSGAGLETIRQFQAQLGAEETERQYGRLFGLLGVGANASTALAGAMSGTSQAQGNLALQGAQGQAQGIQGAAAANAAGLNAISNAALGGINSGVQYSLYSNLINRLPGANVGLPDAGLYASQGGNAFGLNSTLGPQLQTGVTPYTPVNFSITGGS